MIDNNVPLQSQSLQWFTAVVCSLLAGVLWHLFPHPALIVVLGIIPLAVLYTLNRPFLMVLFFVIFSFFRIHEVFPQLYSLKIPLLLSLGSLAALAWQVGITRQIKLFWCKEFTLLTCFLFLIIVGIVLAGNRPIAIEYFKNIYWKIILMTFAIAVLVRTPQQLTFTLRAITIAGVLVGIVAIQNKLGGIGLVEETRVTIGRELGSMLGDPNDLALVLMFPTSFAVGLLVTHQLPWHQRLIGFIAIPILFWAIIATQSRGGLLGIMAVFGIYGLQRIKSKALLLSIAILAGGILFAVAGISDRASGGSAEAGVDASAMGRLYAWEAAFKMALANPLTGVGLDNFYSNYFYYSPHWDGLNHAVHSTWFGVLAETGFLGLSIFIALIVVLIKNANHTLQSVKAVKDRIDPAIYTSAQAVFAGLMGTIVSGTFLTQGFNWPIYILAALVVAVGKTAQVALNQLKE
ncbi:oligosaccharide repeat unit polymerase [Aliivibrio fischeri]|uniref:Membrane protein n=1 Tax=Aliivibrio fischeri TaxID=668 RepID=A0A1E5AL16_ALIFS|nr:O-antigen ligase family protein [Aliivibrio fischeri]MUJ19097.1 oligosaccharide repeat unit polymerase [Aliivibrio fischeri]MUJ27785.1 oligosaccharide repeat unit polymerase [Aliivibrio fischeri]MUK44807.1 oligosaccharide repeat unit polymerase [Aliivibrio fischeri]MUK80466.1 oligosaccharide repeat unit polymerase [Aliivibrio fischeri]MUK84525.1 oligosaccharide repeat unit polymerase [Aliivibrio fischeri]